MPDTSDLLLDRLKAVAASSPSKTAVTFLGSGADGGKVEAQLTYQQLETKTTAIAHNLLAAGLKAGDRAVLVYPPSLDFMVAFLACLKAGIIAVPVFPPNPLRRDTLQMFAVIVDSCQATFALTNASYSYQKKILSIKDSVFFRNKKWPDHLQWIVTDTDKFTSINNNNSKASFPKQHGRNDICFLQYTSGSTSAPKGVMITHGNLAHNLRIIVKELRADTTTTVVSWLPQYHDMGLIGSYLGVLYCGGTGYYMSPLTFLQRPMQWIEAISKYQATHLQAPNFAFYLTARKADTSITGRELDLSHLRHVINAAEPVDRGSMEAFYETFGKYGLRRGVIYPTYGLAEHTVFVCSGGAQQLRVSKETLETDGRVVLVSEEDATTTTSIMMGCGYPARQNVLVQIVDTDTCKSVPEDVVGEIWINSPSKAAGYYQTPEETEHDFNAKLSDAKDGSGYLRTGDLGFMHNDELFICGRLKDLIIIGGRNYYPQDLEATAEASSPEKLRPGCSAAFTIDPTHQGGGEDEEVALVMEVRESSDGDQELANTVRSAINQEHSLGLADIVFVKARTIPKTSSGKIARAWCRKAYLSGTLSVVYRKSFKSNKNNSITPLEVEGNAAPQARARVDANTIRSMSKSEILAKLVTDVSRVGGLPEDAIDKKAALVTMLDSLTLSQFKGMLESHYAVTLSDEYLFRETTSLIKLSEVVKLGYAPDDQAGAGTTPATSAATPGRAPGLAGAMGCPPGVVCVIL